MSPAALERAATSNVVAHATQAAERIEVARVESSPRLTVVDAGLDTDTFHRTAGDLAGYARINAREPGAGRSSGR